MWCCVFLPHPLPFSSFPPPPPTSVFVFLFCLIQETCRYLGVSVNVFQVGLFVSLFLPLFFFLILIHNSSHTHTHTHTHTHGQREKRAPCRTAEPPRDPLFRASFTIVSYRAARVAQRFSAAFSPGRDPGVPGSSPTSGSLHWSLLLPLCLCPPPPLLNLKKKIVSYMLGFYKMNSGEIKNQQSQAVGRRVL